MASQEMGKKIHQYLINQINEVETKSFPHLKCLSTNIHGISHLRRVAYLSGRYAYILKINLNDAVIAGYLHDCARENDSNGNSHAYESAYLAKGIIQGNLPVTNINKIFYTIYHHADGITTKDPFMGCIWDADRLNLLRIGIIPNEKLLSTQLAKRFYSFYINDHPLISHINSFAERISNQYVKFGSAVIGVWYSEATTMVLQFLLNILEDVYNFNFKYLLIYSLFEYKGIPKSHDQSCCYQIYQQISNRLSLDQIISPEEVSNERDLNQRRIPCIVSSMQKCSPGFDFSAINSVNFASYLIPIDTRNYLSRFYEKTSNTPKSYVTFPRKFFESIVEPILITGSSIPGNRINSIASEKWLKNSYRINSVFI